MPLAVLHSPEEFLARYGGAPRSVVTVGNFDGVHLGHREILRRLVERAREAQALSVAVTFDPHPLCALRPESAPALLMTLDQRLAALGEARLDAVLVLRFDIALAQLSPQDFVQRILVDTLRARSILVGENFRFGHRNAGDVPMLREMGKSLSSDAAFEVECVEPVVCRGAVVSSSAIRAAVREGRLIEAARLLGRPFSLSGEISSGTGQGRKLVVPTLNLTTKQELLPKLGVYASEAILGSSENAKAYRAVTNVGVRPTFGGSGTTVETYLFGFDGELRSDKLEVRFWKKLREEIKFPDVGALRQQVLRDAARAQKFFRLLDHMRSAKSADAKSVSVRPPSR